MGNVFVAGIPASGKTTLCRYLAAKLPASRIAVGDLACELGERAGLAAASIEVATWDALVRCQELVAQSLTALRDVAPTGERWLLDGHLVLEGIGRQPFPLPDEVLIAARVRTLVLCDIDSDEIARRIVLDTRRRPPALRGDIARRAAQERAHAERLAERLAVDLVVWDARSAFPIETLSCGRSRIAAS